MKNHKIEVALIVPVLTLLFLLTGCNTVAGVGKDIQGSAEWTKEKIAKDTAK